MKNEKKYEKYIHVYTNIIVIKSTLVFVIIKSSKDGDANYFCTFKYVCTLQLLFHFCGFIMIVIKSTPIIA